MRVRRLLGTREGFDVLLGGGIGGQVEMGRPYRLGVDADQLPTLIEEVVADYYLHHRPGQTFSAYWRELLPEADAAKAEEEDYRPPVWLCEKCQHRHVGVDPPAFCPSCAGLRRFFARLDEIAEPLQTENEANAEPTERADGFLYVAEARAVQEDAGLAVEAGGKELALYRIGEQIHAVDNACPHEGAPLTQGSVQDGVITCPWHGWTFNACSGCSLDPAGHALGAYETLVEDGKVYVKPGAASASGAGALAATARGTPRHAAPIVAELPIVEIIEETLDVRTFRFDNSAGGIPLDHAGKFVSLCVESEGREVWRSFTISSSPARPERLDLTIKLNPEGTVSKHLFAHARPGAGFQLRGPQGGFFYDPDRHVEPLLLVSAGSGVTPMMSMLRLIADRGVSTPCTFVYGARTAADIIFHRECLQRAAELKTLTYHVSLSQPGADWQGACGRLSVDAVRGVVSDLAGRRCFLCGPNEFMDAFREGLIIEGVPADRIHTEQFHAVNLARN